MKRFPVFAAKVLKACQLHYMPECHFVPRNWCSIGAASEESVAAVEVGFSVSYYIFAVTPLVLLCCIDDVSSIT